jgi:hypothetical protein
MPQRRPFAAPKVVPAFRGVDVVRQAYPPPVTVSVRVLEPGESEGVAPSLLRLLTEFTLAAATQTPEIVAERVRAAELRVVVAEQAGNLLGMATLCLYATLSSGAVGYVEDVIVTETVRGKGI